MRKSTNKWTRRQAEDPFVKRRQREGHRSRAAFKLEELNKKDRLISAGDYVIDLGSAPGGWTESASKLSGKTGKVVAIDRRRMDEINCVTFLEGSCSDNEIIERVKKIFGSRGVDLVLSDLAPNITGIRVVDEAAWKELIEVSLGYVNTFLRPGGSFVAKFFQFEDTEEIISDLKSQFSSVNRRKPASSRKESREFFIVAKEYKV